MTSRNKNDVKKLFEFWCELSQDGSIVESFPENFRDKKTIADIPSFAFPCELEGESVQSYSFVLTTDDSKWRFGFCRHDPKAKLAMVLITYLPWHDTFLRFLTVLAELRRSIETPNQNEFRAFIAEAYNHGIPDPGGNLKLFYNAGLNYFVFERPRQFQLPSIPENHNLNLYYNFVDPKNMIAVFAAMLAERRIIFASRRLDRLSSCIQAAHAFLYPMVWQHIFIPVIPMKLKDYLSAPMPYLIGVPEAVLEMVTPEELGEVVIMNCDTKIFESPFDDVHELPNEIVTQLKKQLSNSHEHIGDRVSKIFLGVLVQLIGTYRDGVEFREAGKIFNRDRFIESRPSHLRPFLTKMMELQIFQQFIDERLEMLNTGLGFSDEFEMETARYAEKMKKRGRNYAFLKNVKDKTNPAVKSAVKSVKESSRGVKTAYKDLKSKLRDIPGTNTNFRSHLASNSHHDRIDGYQLSNGTAGHRSAPSSPVFHKRSIGGLSLGNTTAVTNPYGGSPKIINGAAQYLRRAPAPLATSSSSAHIHTVATHGLAYHGNHLGASPTVSPASSLCSSDMNLSQELQNHPLFKSPAVDRSSLRSLQPQHLKVQQPSASAAGSLNSVVPSTSSQEDTMNDLISLDDSHNSSFDLEDFDPLNQNARPLPLCAGTTKTSKSTTLPTKTTTTATTATPHSISNPIYPYFTAKQNLQNCRSVLDTTPPGLQLQLQPPPLPSTSPPRDDDFELLRKYGLDQFTLTSVGVNEANPVNALATSTTATTTTSMRNWTTFD